MIGSKESDSLGSGVHGDSRVDVDIERIQKPAWTLQAVLDEVEILDVGPLTVALDQFDELLLGYLEVGIISSTN